MQSNSTRKDGMPPTSSNGQGDDGKSPIKSESVTVKIDGRLIVLQRERLLKFAEFLAVNEDNDASPGPDHEKDTESDSQSGDAIEVEELLGLLFPPPSSASPAEPVKDPKYYLDTALFQVEDSRFIVPTHHFLQSNIFCSMEGMCTTGSNSEEPTIVLSGVLKVDFSALLKLLHSPRQTPKLSVGEWESILKLATKWRMSTFRRMALDALSSMPIPPSERVRLGREYSNPHWLLSGFTDLVERQESLTVEEFRAVGIENALTLSQNLRRRHRSHNMAVDLLYDCMPHPNPFKDAVDGLFQDEIQEQCSSVDVVDRILLARTYGISEWASAGYFDLAARKDDVTADEGRKLGLDATVKICSARENVGGLWSGGPFYLEEAVESSFATELGEARRASKHFGDYALPEDLERKLEADAEVDVAKDLLTSEEEDEPSTVAAPAPLPAPEPVPEPQVAPTPQSSAIVSSPAPLLPPASPPSPSAATESVPTPVPITSLSPPPEPALESATPDPVASSSLVLEPLPAAALLPASPTPEQEQEPEPEPAPESAPETAAPALASAPAPVPATVPPPTSSTPEHKLEPEPTATKSSPIPKNLPSAPGIKQPNGSSGWSVLFARWGDIQTQGTGSKKQDVTAKTTVKKTASTMEGLLSYTISAFSAPASKSGGSLKPASNTTSVSVNGATTPHRVVQPEDDLCQIWAIDVEAGMRGAAV